MSVTSLPDRYALGPILGAGGSGEVYAATDRISGERVAIKFFRDRRGWAAALKASAVRHPNAVPIVEAGDHEGTAFLIMPLIEGHTLAHLLERGTFTPRLALDLLADVAAALDDLHGMGIVHRDIKPSNIMVTDDSTRAVLLDYGAAASHDLDTEHEFVGTPAYAAPEHLGRERIGPAADVYGLAAVLAECITSTRLFSRPTHEETMLAHAKRDRPLVETDDPVARVLAPVLEKGLAVNPNERYGTASDLIEAAREVLGELPPGLVDRPIGQTSTNEPLPTTEWS